MLYVHQNRKRIVISVALGCILLYCIWPTRFAAYYNYIDGNRIYDLLVPEISRNISLQQVDDCEYIDVIKDNTFLYTKTYREKIFESQDIRVGGEYYPEECRPRFSSAIVIPYRQREQQLNQFLIYMHNFLRKQRIHYRIFLIEQYDRKPFNKGKLLNIGSVIAAEHGFPCLILHDVDMMPLSLGQLYACTQQPRHMSSSLDSFRFNLLYEELFGGAVAIRTEQFRFANGMSNMFLGWGGEDDDFYGRLRAKNFSIYRFEPEFSRYTMLAHTKEAPNVDRLVFLRNGPLRFHSDGLNSLVYTQKGLRLHSLFTHILVET